GNARDSSRLLPVLQDSGLSRKTPEYSSPIWKRHVERHRGRLELRATAESTAESYPSAMIFLVSTQSHRGRFITFEGLDGCGKSTQLERLAKALRADGFPITVTREPGGTAMGEKIRNLLLDSATAGLSPLAELALMFASRAQHLEEVVQPALTEGRIVLSDRFTDSTEAYQGGGRKIGIEPVLALHRIVCRKLHDFITSRCGNKLSPRRVFPQPILAVPQDSLKDGL